MQKLQEVVLLRNAAKCIRKAHSFLIPFLKYSSFTGAILIFGVPEADA